MIGLAHNVWQDWPFLTKASQTVIREAYNCFIMQNICGEEVGVGFHIVGWHDLIFICAGTHFYKHQSIARTRDRRERESKRVGNTHTKGALTNALILGFAEKNT